MIYRPFFQISSLLVCSPALHAIACALAARANVSNSKRNSRKIGLGQKTVLSNLVVVSVLVFVTYRLVGMRSIGVWTARRYASILNKTSHSQPHEVNPRHLMIFHIRCASILNKISHSLVREKDTGKLRSQS